MDKQNLAYDQQTFNRLASAGNSVSFLIQEQTVLGFVAQGDQIKPEAKNLIDSLKAQNITPVMLTGDNPQSAQVVAKQLGITEVHAGLLPEDKAKLVQQYQADGSHVMMIGDGVNDALVWPGQILALPLGLGLTLLLILLISFSLRVIQMMWSISWLWPGERPGRWRKIYGGVLDTMSSQSPWLLVFSHHSALF